MLVLITNRKLCGDEALIPVVSRAIQAGVDRVILREKDLPDAVLYPTGQALMAELCPHQKLIVHSSIELACSLGAHGVHFGLDHFLSIPKEEIRQFKKNHTLEMGVSIHSLEEALKAQTHGADYILASHVFDTACKAGTPGRGCDFIQTICNHVSIPVIGLGGINASNLDQVLKSGASGIALMSGIMEAQDVHETCTGLLKTIKACLQP